MRYIELHIEVFELEPWREIIVTVLAENGAESFVETKAGCLAYFPENKYPGIDNCGHLDYKDKIKSVTEKIIEDQNWNASWEKNFEPVFVGDQLAILAPFHNQNTKHQIKVLIQPQMSFGTGHHQTTWLMSEKLLSLKIKGKTILDMGTGTGVLAILAEKLGAKKVFAPDIDEWAFNNAVENCKLNKSQNVLVVHGGAELLKEQKFDILIANINKNILIQQFTDYAKVANKGALLLLSGFFKTDIDELKVAALKSGFIFENSSSKDEWALMELIKN
ncbi:MAG: 50S ribosomal protein L11 methyltransferase [Crocinitomicaceae bacterium]